MRHGLEGHRTGERAARRGSPRAAGGPPPAQEVEDRRGRRERSKSRTPGELNPREGARSDVIRDRRDAGSHEPGVPEKPLTLGTEERAEVIDAAGEVAGRVTVNGATESDTEGAGVVAQIAGGPGDKMRLHRLKALAGKFRGGAGPGH